MVPAGTFPIYDQNAGGNMYGVVVAPFPFAQLIANVVETGGQNEATDTIKAQWTGQTFVTGVADEPVRGTSADAPYTVGYFGAKAPAYVDRSHAYFAADVNLPIPEYLVNQEYIMSGNDNKQAGYQLDVTVNTAATVYFLWDQRNNSGIPPAWVLDGGFVPMKTGANRTGDSSIPDEVGIDESADNTIDQRFNIYAKVVPAGTFTLHDQNAGGNMYGVVIGRNPRPQLIANVVETGGQNEATDTIVAQWTGQTFVTGVADEPVRNTSADAPYTVGYFGNKAPAYVDRSHAYFAADVNLPIPLYLLNQEYIMSGNDNKQAGYQLDVTVNAPATVYFLWDQRNDPPPAWLASEGFTAMMTGANRTADKSIPDEVGIDEGADNSINQRFNIYAKVVPAGTFTLYDQNAGGNMYGVVVGQAPAMANAVQNNSPTFDLSTNLVASARGAAVQTVPLALNLSAGPPSEASQTVMGFDIVNNDNPGLLASLAIAPDGTLTYESAGDVCGRANITIVAKDNGGAAINPACGGNTSEPATFTIWIFDVNACPVATTQAVVSDEDTSVPLTLAVDDADRVSGCGSVDFTYQIITPPAHGILTGEAPDLVYTPDPDYCGADSFTYLVSDGECTAEEASVVNLTVNPTEDCPVAMDQSVIADQGSAVPITLAAIDPDATCDLPSFRFWVIPPSHGQLRGMGANLTYMSNPNYCGSDSFVFLVDDGICFSRGTVTIEVHGVNQCPVADAQLVTTCEDSPVAITLTGSDPDENGCGPTLQSFAIASQPAHGTLTGTAPNVTYTPATDYNGMDSFTFTATDGECVSDPAVVSIQVQLANDGPVCHIVVGPLLQITPDVTENLVLSCDNQTAEVVLDATLCSDPENNALTYVWQVDGLPVGNEAILSTMLPLGTHEVTLTVDDGNPGTGECAGEGTSSTGTTMVTVIDGCEAVEELVLLVEQSNIDAKLKSTFNKHLKDACKKLAKGRCQEGVKQLQSFQDKVRNYDEFYKSPSKKRKSAKQLIDHETAQRLIDGSQAVIDAYAPCACMGWR